jgi:arylsulfatase A-like enzyme
LQRGFDDFYGFYTGSFEHYTKYVFLGAEDPPHGYTGYDLHDGYDNVMDLRHATELFSDRAVKVVRSHDRRQPLFLYLALSAPHYPLTPMPEHLARCQHMKTYRRQRPWQSLRQEKR